MNKKEKSLTTVIVIIIVAALLLYSSIFYFGHSNLSVLPCFATPGYSCQNYVLETNGTFSFLFGQYTSPTIYNIKMACAATETTAGLPNPPSALENITYYLQNGTMISVALQCYGASGTAFSGSIGSPFSGFIWLNYTNNSTIPSSTNPWHTLKVATISLNAT
jgi:hypothetical protein